MPSPIVTVCGIRHHGPGSARSVVRVLDDLQPTVVLVELPADCESALTWVGHTELQPPVALLGHVVGQPQRAAFLPFATFSPEWQAFVWAAARDVPVRAIDLPLAVSLAGTDEQLAIVDRPLVDPLGALAAAAGDLDAERWWDDMVEHRGDGAPAFAAVAEAMAAVRADTHVVAAAEALREAHMRQVLRRAIADGHERIAVVCGAWHAPALSAPLPSAAADAKLLRGLSKVKVAVSWVPWTHRRLAMSSGLDPITGEVHEYSAGVRSPGWYAHVFEHPGPEGISRWFVGMARLLREHGLSASPDHLISATRAAAALAALRGRPRPGLAEVLDAADAVMAGSAGLALVEQHLVVGHAIGSVPAEAPTVPLARDLAAQQRKVRLAPTADRTEVELDLRTPNGRARSELLHRVAALGVPWGALIEGRGSTGTFRETWALRWEPELSIRLIEQAAHGTTVQMAATRCLVERAVAATASLADLVAAIDRALLAVLPDALSPIIAALEGRAAREPDVTDLIGALPQLATALRYGEVRGTDASALQSVFHGLVTRVLAGLVVACRSLDDDAARTMVERVSEVQGALALTSHPARAGEWPAVLSILSERFDVHGLVQGRATRLLHDCGAWRRPQISARVSRALSPGTTPAASAAFVEGFVAGSGTVLVHDRGLLEVIDTWLSSLSADTFVATVPLLRRTFGSFEPAERRQLGTLLASDERPTESAVDDALDALRVERGLVAVRHMLGVPV